MRNDTIATTEHQDLLRRIELDLLDGYDEELELELGDRNIDALADPADADPALRRNERHHYFRELFRLQAELVKLQDWVAETGHEVVIIFDGDDQQRVVRQCAKELGREQHGKPGCQRLRHHAHPRCMSPPRSVGKAMLPAAPSM